jgi:hypothetical protein
VTNSAAGNTSGMSTPETPDPERVAHRADELLPEELEAGSDNPQAQAEAILEESDERSADGTAGPGAPVEHRTSSQATPPA